MIGYLWMRRRCRGCHGDRCRGQCSVSFLFLLRNLGRIASGVRILPWLLELYSSFKNSLNAINNLLGDVRLEWLKIMRRTNKVLIVQHLGAVGWWLLVGWSVC